MTLITVLYILLIEICIFILLILFILWHLIVIMSSGLKFNLKRSNKQLSVPLCVFSDREQKRSQKSMADPTTCSGYCLVCYLGLWFVPTQSTFCRRTNLDFTTLWKSSEWFSSPRRLMVCCSSTCEPTYNFHWLNRRIQLLLFWIF